MDDCRSSHLISVAKWHPHLDPYADNVTKITAWVRFPGLPIEFYHSQALMKLGSLVGPALYVDKATLRASRGTYARVCVELDLQKTVLAKYRIKNRIHRIEYQGLHNICFTYGLFGHNKEQCPSRAEEERMDNGEDIVTKTRLVDQRESRPEVFEE